ncbi:hypothetical protein N7326_02540 [Corynebacterium sp. ES2794-CONJ1]|uniref:hypothetical protein n=1 Tax=unclassified Corynebacterium TaxID=2624378 RepID=UPI00216AE142|nr:MULTISPECIES: hypothetical protein [unclassified Corynebacterium]MCS4531363.1 hypothetical protein [Corynebacterium sp. ES2730-CONJ]MCU9518750.1 hypothetical protein [Corynebacterium sp. ES2794-CONJ1]
MVIHTAPLPFMYKRLLVATCGALMLISGCSESLPHESTDSTDQPTLQPIRTAVKPVGVPSLGPHTQGSQHPTTHPTTKAQAPTSRVDTPSTRTQQRALNGPVERTRDAFSTLAPDSLFAQFDSCQPNGVSDSMACTGPEVGQFQFFSSDAKAASTTQILTELRSSRVMYDSGRFVVGWSTVGNTAIITAIDNGLGLVMQQMVSTYDVDPKERISTLGLIAAVESPRSHSVKSISEPTPEATSATSKSIASRVDPGS